MNQQEKKRIRAYQSMAGRIAATRFNADIPDDLKRDYFELRKRYGCTHLEAIVGIYWHQLPV